MTSQLFTLPLATKKCNVIYERFLNVLLNLYDMEGIGSIFFDWSYYTRLLMTSHILLKLVSQNILYPLQPDNVLSIMNDPYT